MSIIGAAQQQDRNRVEDWTPVGKSWAKAIYVAHADNVTLESGKLATINDISGNGNHAVQTVVADQLDYTVSDSRAGGLSTFGAIVNTGSRCITTPFINISRVYIVAIYDTGVESPMASTTALISGSDSGSAPYFYVAAGSSTYLGGAMVGSLSKNGAATSTTVTPLPLSVMVVNVLNGPYTKQFSIGSRRAYANTTFKGAYRGLIFTSGEETFDEYQRTEGWLAKSSNIQNLLPSGHPYK